MKLYCALFLFCFLATMTEAASELPEKFFGRYELDKSENFDEFLAAKGVSWFVRQMIKLAKVTKVLAKSETPGKYNMETLTSKANAVYHDVTFGQTFEANGLDGNRHKITFSYTDGVLSEHHIRENDPSSAETYYYTIENDQLVMKMVNNGITCRRWFKRSKK